MQCERCSDRKINPGDKPCYSLLTSSLNKYSVITIWRTGSLGPIWEEVAPFFERWKCRALITALAARWGLDRGAWKRHGGQLVLGRLPGRSGPWAEMGWWIRREPKRDFSRERNMIKLMEVGWAGIPQLVAHMCNSWTLRGWSVFWEEVTSEGNDTPLQCPCLENPMMEEPGRLQSMGSLRVGHDWATSLSRIGEANGNLLQCSCLENPRDGGAWWAAVYGVAQSRTRLKRLSSSSNTIKAWQVCTL